MTDLGLSTAQLNNAQTVVAVGKADGFGDVDIATAVMVALTESGLQNYANQNVPESLNIPHDAVGSDHNSVGIFQQQVGIWGTAQELMDPATAAQKFYTALRQKYPHGTIGQSPWMVAQSIQNSAYSDGSNYKTNWTRGLSIEEALIANANSIPHVGIGGPWKVGSLTAPLPDATRNQLITWLIAHSSPWQNDPKRTAQTAHLQQTSDGDLITQYNDLAKGYSVQGGDPGQAVPGTGPSIVSWTSSLGKILSWLTDKSNWERIGLFVLGGILLLVTFNKMFGGVSAGTVAKAALA